MPPRQNNEQGFYQILIPVLGALATILIGIGAYYLKDMSETMRYMREDMAVVKTKVQAQGEEMAYLRKDQDDLRIALYQHMTKGN